MIFLLILFIINKKKNPEQHRETWAEDLITLFQQTFFFHFFLLASYLLATSQVNQVQLADQLLFCLHVFLLDVYQEDAVTAGTVLIHV